MDTHNRCLSPDFPRFNATDDGGDNFIIRAKIKLNAGAPSGSRDETGVMTIWKKIEVEYVKMQTADDLPVSGIPGAFAKAYVQMDIALTRVVADGVVDNGTPPAHQWVMGLDNPAARTACYQYVTKTGGEFSKQGPGWFFIASAHEFRPLTSLTSEVLYPASGTAGSAMALGDRITLPSAIPAGKIPDIVLIYDATLAKNVLFVVQPGTLSADRTTFEIETKDYHAVDSPSSAFLDADLSAYGFANGSTIQVSVHSPGAYGPSGISPGLAGRTIVFTKGFNPNGFLRTLVHELTHSFGFAHLCGNWDYTTSGSSCCMNYGAWFVLNDATPRAPIHWTNGTNGTSLCAPHIKAIREQNLEDLGNLGWD